MPGYPFGAIEVAFERPTGSIGLAIGVNMQDDTRDLTPIGFISIGVEHPCK